MEDLEETTNWTSLLWGMGVRNLSCSVRVGGGPVLSIELPLTGVEVDILSLNPMILSVKKFKKSLLLQEAGI